MASKQERTSQSQPASHPSIWRKRLRRNILWLSLLAFVWFICSAPAAAGPLTDRQQTFPNWETKPPVGVSEGDLYYPQWIIH
ncbi:MAG: hypothetical protein ABG776_03845 [Cyanobacteria bacterium J06555_13]